MIEVTPISDTKWTIFASLWNGLSQLSVSMYYISRCLPHSQLPSQWVKSGAEPNQAFPIWIKQALDLGCSQAQERNPHSKKKGKEEVKVFLCADYMIVHKPSQWIYKNNPRTSKSQGTISIFKIQFQFYMDWWKTNIKTQTHKEN